MIVIPGVARDLKSLGGDLNKQLLQIMLPRLQQVHIHTFFNQKAVKLCRCLFVAERKYEQAIAPGGTFIGK
jgi:hypothetical protein